MISYLDTYRIFKDEDTNVTRTIRLAMAYVDMCGPFEDMGYIFPEEEHVTGFRDATGELIMVTEPFQKILDNWLLALEQEAHKPITFSQQ